MILKPVLPIYVLIFVGLVFIAFVVFMLTNKKQRSLSIRRIAMLILMFVILLRPMVRGGTTVLQENSTNIFFAVDLTNSMTVNDCENDQRRYEKMRADIRKIAEAFPGARYAIFALDYEAHTALPLTDDVDALLNYADNMSVTDSDFSNGSDISKLIVYAMEHIDKYRELFPERKNILFVMSDGERTNNTDPNIKNTQLSALSTARVYGYGTTSGGYVKEVSRGEIENYSTNHISKIDENNLQKIATTLGGNYENWTNGGFEESKITEIASELELRDSGVISSYRDTYWIFALMLAVLLLWELSDCLNKVLDERKAIKKW